MNKNIKKLIPEIKKNKTIGKKKSNKNLRRNLRRIADRKCISYKEAILNFYQVKTLDKLDKNLVYSLFKNSDGII